MAERLPLRSAPVDPQPPLRYRAVAETPAQCPRAGCGGLLRDWPDGKLCAACGRVFLVDELLRRARPREVNA